MYGGTHAAKKHMAQWRTPARRLCLDKQGQNESTNDLTATCTGVFVWESASKRPKCVCVRFGMVSRHIVGQMAGGCSISFSLCVSKQHLQHKHFKGNEATCSRWVDTAHVDLQPQKSEINKLEFPNICQKQLNCCNIRV